MLRVEVGARALRNHLVTWYLASSEHHRTPSALRVDPGILRPAPMNLSPERGCEVAESTRARKTRSAR